MPNPKATALMKPIKRVNGKREWFEETDIFLDFLFYYTATLTAFKIFLNGGTRELVGIFDGLCACVFRGTSGALTLVTALRYTW